MNLLIVAATQFEIEPFLKENSKAEVLITGVGIPVTVFHLTKKLLEKKYDFVIQAGIAGTFPNRFKLAEVVVVKEDTFGDEGIEENGEFKTIFENGFGDKNNFPFNNGWLINNSFLQEINLPLVKGITVNTVTDNQIQNQLRKEKFSADIETMEGAAFHYVCLQQKMNFIQLRGISNNIGERNKTKWETAEAIKNLNEELFKITKTLSI